MKCPKCGYLGFETSDRCRNCGYDFSLALEITPASELPLHSQEGPGEPLADFDLSKLDTTPSTDEIDDRRSTLDLDRLIGVETPAALTPPDARSAPSAPDAPGARSAPNAPNAPSAPSAPSPLPLFSEGDDDTPLITSPRPLRPPLAVRRTTPEIPRTRARRVTPRPDEQELALLAAEPAREPIAPPATPVAARPTADGAEVAAPWRRLVATLIDMVLLGTINVAVVYLTLALADLGVEQFDMLPLTPLVTFLVLLNGGYLVTFIAASGQTIGKMATGIRVMGDDGRRVDIAGAVLRAAGCGVSLLTAGLGYLPAFITSDGRALQDRIAGTRVVSAR
jgi:resuscitation-promoting factor RpfA